MARRMLGAAGAVLLAALGISLAVASPAFASGSGDQFCGATNNVWYCINAWYGGPNVNIYTGGPNVYTNDFTAYRTPQGNIELQYTGGGGDTGECLGDRNNDPNNASTGLTGCPTTGAGGWGTQLTQESGSPCAAGTVAFWDNHWGGFIAPPANWGNGDPFYLNNSYVGCFNIYTAS